jgi:hypothetical protein
MFAKRQTNAFKTVPADFVAGEEMRVGMLVKVNYANKTVMKAVDGKQADAIVVRGSKVSLRNALGLQESIFDEFQNAIPQGEKVGIYIFENGERFATDNMEDALKVKVEDDSRSLEEKRADLLGVELTVDNGNLKEAAVGDTVIAHLYRIDQEGFNNRQINNQAFLNSAIDNVVGLYDLKENFVISFAIVKPYTK